jgi:serine/threonine protein kinase
MLYAIGRGGFGKVWRVESKKEKEQFAMKEMTKARIISKKSV